MGSIGNGIRRAATFLATFVGSALLLVMIWAAIETLTPWRLPLGAARVAMVWTIGAIAAAIAWMVARRRSTRTEPKATDAPSTAEPVRRRTLAMVQEAAVAAETPPLNSDRATPPEDAAPTMTPASRDDAGVIAAARARPIVLRRPFPPPATLGLSFYGGRPVAPPTLAWPRRASDDRPLTFIMQWDAAVLAREDATGLMPADGALYLFGNLDWGDELEFRFVHAEAGPGDWAALTPPDDLPPPWGSDAASNFEIVSAIVPAERRDVPKLLPCWPFEPMAIDYPTGDTDEDTLFWDDTGPVKEVLVRAQDPTGALVPEPGGPKPRFVRPFAGFPHDWAAVRVAATGALDRLSRIAEWQWRSFAPDVDVESRTAMTEAWRTEALALYEEATAHDPAEALAGTISDALWQRIATLEMPLKLFDLARESVNASLGLRSAGVAAIPPAVLQTAASAHSLGFAYERDEYEREFEQRLARGGARSEAQAAWRASGSDADYAKLKALEAEEAAAYARAKADGTLLRLRQVFAPTPNRMLGPPNYVQGDVEAHVRDRLLLLELTSSSQIGFGMGDGVLQFMIRPADLAARRFDRVEVIGSSY